MIAWQSTRRSCPESFSPLLNHQAGYGTFAGDLMDRTCVTLAVIPSADARALLLRLCPRVGQYAEALAQLCGWQPLALRLAASLLKVHRQLALEDYLPKLRESRERIRSSDRSHELTNEDLGLQAAFAVSFDHLSTLQKQRFAQLSVFPASFDRPAAAAVWAIEESTAEELLDGLLGLALLERDRQSQRFSLHDLLRDFARGRAEERELDHAALRHAEYHTGIARHANELWLKGGEEAARGLALFDREWPNLEAAFDWLTPRSGTNSTRLLASLVDAVLCTADLRVPPAELARWQAARSNASGTSGVREEGAANGSNVGPTDTSSDDLRAAIKGYEEQLAWARAVGDRPREGLRLGDLGNARLELGELRQAIELYEQALAITRETGDLRYEAVLLGSLGTAQLNSGQPRKAIECYQKAAAITRETGDQHWEAKYLSALGTAHAAAGAPRQALECCEQVLAIRRSTGDRRGEGAALWNSALQFWRLNERAEAIARAGTALRICEAMRDPHVTMIRAALAKWKATQGGQAGNE